MRNSNHVVGLVNFLTFVMSIPILGGGIWLSSRANKTECLEFLQWPLIVIGACIMVISLAGFAGSCYRNTLLMWLYLFVMFFILVALVAFIIFAYAVTNKGSGRPVLNRSYHDYYLQDYSGWLKDRVVNPSYWAKISSCIRDSKVCSKMWRNINGVPETGHRFFLTKLSPIESGCCKPPTVCHHVYNNETVWILGGDLGGDLVGTNQDCSIWSNDQERLCYQCDSCKAGVLGSVDKSWRKVSVINIIMLVLLVIFYVIGFAAFRNDKRIDNGEPRGKAKMEKVSP
ncbi:hypothetical protein SLE2022_002820 [Rubroshorea leprosula]